MSIFKAECADSEDGGDGEEDGEDEEDEMVGRMLLKNNYKLSDEGAVARWMVSPYMQDFTGERGDGRRKVFQKRPAMNPVRST